MGYYPKQKFVSKAQRRRQDRALIAAGILGFVAYGAGIYGLTKISPSESSEITTEVIQTLDQNELESVAETVRTQEEKTIPLEREDGSELIILGLLNDDNYIFRAGYLTYDKTGICFDDVIYNIQQRFDDEKKLYIFHVNNMAKKDDSVISEDILKSQVFNFTDNVETFTGAYPNTEFISVDLCFPMQLNGEVIYSFLGSIVHVDTLKSIANERGKTCQFNIETFDELVYMQYGLWEEFYGNDLTSETFKESYTLRK